MDDHATARLERFDDPPDPHVMRRTVLPQQPRCVRLIVENDAIELERKHGAEQESAIVRGKPT